MNDIIILLPIAAFIALAAGLAVVLRGTGRIVARTREVDQFRAGVKGLAARIDVSLGTAASEIDALRRRQVDPEAIATTVTSTKDAVEVYLEEARALKCPGEARQIQSSIVTDLERAQRALGMVEHGTTIMATARRGPRELKAPDFSQTWLPESHPCARSHGPSRARRAGIRHRRSDRTGGPSGHLTGLRSGRDPTRHHHTI